MLHIDKDGTGRGARHREVAVYRDIDSVSIYVAGNFDDATLRNIRDNTVVDDIEMPPVEGVKKSILPLL